VSEDDQDEEHPQPSSGNGEEVDRDQISDMVREERAPGLRGRRRSPWDQAGHRTFGHVDPELQELASELLTQGELLEGELAVARRGRGRDEAG
jgi:hypothetical protein